MAPKKGSSKSSNASSRPRLSIAIQSRPKREVVRRREESGVKYRDDVDEDVIAYINDTSIPNPSVNSSRKRPPQQLLIKPKPKLSDENNGAKPNVFKKIKLDQHQFHKDEEKKQEQLNAYDILMRDHINFKRIAFGRDLRQFKSPAKPFHIVQEHLGNKKPINWHKFERADVIADETYLSHDPPEQCFSLIDRRNQENTQCNKLLGFKASCCLSNDKITKDLSKLERLWQLEDLCNKEIDILDPISIVDQEDSNISPNDRLQHVISNIKQRNKSKSSKFLEFRDLNMEDLQKRLSSYHMCHHRNQDSSKLWTEKYKPMSSIELCGNKDSIKSMCTWLDAWRRSILNEPQRFYQDKKENKKKKAIFTKNKESKEKPNKKCNNKQEEKSFKKVLLLTGPVASGKSTAIYACATEYGFEVIEVNASDIRNGGELERIFGETITSKTMMKKSHMEEAKIMEKGLVTYNCMGRNKLFLFEDVNIVFSEDRGFLIKLTEFAKKSFYPIILTSNHNNPRFPRLPKDKYGIQLDDFKIQFVLPSIGELVIQTFLVCVVEAIKINFNQVEEIIKLCNGDLRKTLLLLQFWMSKEGKVTDIHDEYTPLEDFPKIIDAHHQIMLNISIVAPNRLASKGLQVSKDKKIELDKDELNEQKFNEGNEKPIYSRPKQSKNSLEGVMISHRMDKEVNLKLMESTSKSCDMMSCCDMMLSYAVPEPNLCHDDMELFEKRDKVFYSDNGGIIYDGLENPAQVAAEVAHQSVQHLSCQYSNLASSMSMLDYNIDENELFSRNIRFSNSKQDSMRQKTRERLLHTLNPYISKGGLQARSKSLLYEYASHIGKICKIEKYRQENMESNLIIQRSLQESEYYPKQKRLKSTQGNSIELSQSISEDEKLFLIEYSTLEKDMHE